MLYRIITDDYLEYLKTKPVYSNEIWLEKAYQKDVCSLCGYINRRQYPKSLDVILDNPPDGHTSAMIENTKITVWRRDFLNLISSYLEGFTIGKCWLSDGTEIEQYATCYGPTYIIIRGNKNSRYDICTGCGTIKSIIPPGPEYVLLNNLDERKVYQDAECRIYLSEDIAFQFDFDNWGEDKAFIGLNAVSVREYPADGQKLPGDTVKPSLIK